MFKNKSIKINISNYYFSRVELLNVYTVDVEDVPVK